MEEYIDVKTVEVGDKVHYYHMEAGRAYIEKRA